LKRQFFLEQNISLPYIMETEYIRGKVQERNGALTRRPSARFDARGNDVWAARSGREYLPDSAGMSGGAADYSSPVTGNGMGNLARLVGGRRRRGGAGLPPNKKKQEILARQRRELAAMSPEERQAMAEKNKAEMADLVARQNESALAKEKEIADSRYNARQQRQSDYEKSHPFMGFLNKLGRAVPSAARGVASVASALVPGARLPAMGLTALANQMEKDSSRARRPNEMSGGAHVRYSRMVGGSELSLSPFEAQHLMMMDYRGGKHPYLTKTGRERRHIKGSGVWDWVKKVGNEFTNPESVLRGKYIPQAAEGLSKAAELGEQVANFVPGPYGEAARRAAAAVKTASKVAKGVSAANKGIAAAQYAARGDYSKALSTGKEAAEGLKGAYDDYNAYRAANARFPRPNLPTGPRRPQAERDGVGRPLAVGNTRREPAGRDLLRLEDRKPAGLTIKDREPLLMLEDRPKVPKFTRSYGAAPYKDLQRLENRNLGSLEDTGAGRRRRGGAVPVLRDLELMTPSPRNVGGRKPNARAAIVRQVMDEQGLSMIEASKYVKAHNLY